MTAKVNFWSMQYDGMNHSWTTGKDYNIFLNGDIVHIDSDSGQQDVPKAACIEELFECVFGLDLSQEQ